MRALDQVTLANTTFTLAYPQDGIQQPATYISTDASRAASISLTSLARPNGNNPLNTKNVLELVIPVVQTVDGVEKVVALNRVNLTTSIDAVSTSDDTSKISSLLSAIVADTQFAKAIKGERLV